MRAVIPCSHTPATLLGAVSNQQVPPCFIVSPTDTCGWVASLRWGSIRSFLTQEEGAIPNQLLNLVSYPDFKKNCINYHSFNTIWHMNH